MIRSTIDPKRNLTIHTCTEDVSPEDIREVISSVYSGQPTLHQLWDETDASVQGIPGESLREFAKLASDQEHLRPGGKTAIVSPVDLGFGLGRLYAARAELTHQEVQVSAFRSLDEAYAWIDEG